VSIKKWKYIPNLKFVFYCKVTSIVVYYIGNNSEGGCVLNFTEKLDYLLKQREINKSTLSKESGIPLSTILSWYDPNKGYKNIRTTTMLTLAKYLGCSMDYLADESILPEIKDTQDKHIFMQICNNADLETRRQFLQHLLDLITTDKTK
jgi:DNA-binding Xre family transcriptional regulator